MTSRSRYWSCSRFVDWLRGTAKISSGTGSEWRLWKTAAKETHPIRYWLAEEGLDRDGRRRVLHCDRVGRPGVHRRLGRRSGHPPVPGRRHG